jgi:hypothetical protein
VEKKDEEAAEPRARERTTSPLQIGQVRRRVVSQGVLENGWVSRAGGNGKEGMAGGCDSHALGVKFVTAGETHDSADAIDVFFQADDTFPLFAAVSSPPFREAGRALFFNLFEGRRCHLIGQRRRGLRDFGGGP